jgi:hypothetical protein
MINKRRFVDTPEGTKKKDKEAVRTRWISAALMVVVISIAAAFGRGAEAYNNDVVPPLPRAVQTQPNTTGWQRVAEPVDSTAGNQSPTPVDNTVYTSTEPVWESASGKEAQAPFHTMTWYKAIGIGAFVTLLILWIRT